MAAAPEPIVFPAGITVVPLAGGTGGLDVLALTLQKGPTSTELYAAVRNDAATPACDVGFSVELFDKDQLSIAASIADLASKSFYRLNDCSGNLAVCIAPGEVGMSAVLDLPADIAIESVGFVQYRTPFFALPVTPITGIAISQVMSVAEGGGVAYQGTLINGLDREVTEPSVKVFPLTADGRPLGVATDRGTADLTHGGTWDFHTSAVVVTAQDFAAFPSATLK